MGTCSTILSSSSATSHAVQAAGSRLTQPLYHHQYLAVQGSGSSVFQQLQKQALLRQRRLWQNAGTVALLLVAGAVRTASSPFHHGPS
jgi:hypothetical protein